MAGAIGDTTPNKRTSTIYAAMLILTVAVFVIGSIYRMIGEVIVSIPVIAILVAAIFFEKRMIHIPPTFIAIALIMMYATIISKLLPNENYAIDGLNHILLGIMLGTVGLVVVYIMLGRMPGFMDEKPSLVALEGFTFGIALYSLWLLCVYYTSEQLGIDMGQSSMMNGLMFVTIGSAIVSLLYYSDKHIGFFTHTVDRFLDANSETIGISSENETKDIMDIIAKGESGTLEFKSTLRTNLETGEKDKRMETAVLKTIVAFLNTDGGTLLVGVSDDGGIVGADVDTFENPDKFNLHFTNIISSRIGDEYNPFIKFKLLCIDGKYVLRVVCKSTSTPTFLKDGKAETYYIRSGPSSIDIAGTDLVRYVSNREKKGKREAAVQSPIRPDA